MGGEGEMGSSLERDQHEHHADEAAVRRPRSKERRFAQNLQMLLCERSGGNPGISQTFIDRQVGLHAHKITLLELITLISRI